MKTYGIDKFRLVPMEKCTENSIDAIEIKWISLKNSIHPNGYNIRSGGNNFNKHHSDVTKKFISTQTSQGITKCINNFRKYKYSKGLPKYISYYVRTDRKNHTHGFNVYHKPSKTRKTIMTKIDQPITQKMKQLAISKLDNIIKMYKIRKEEGSETKC